MKSDHYEYKPRGKKSPTPRQLELMAYLAEGQSRKEVAHNLGISVQTIKNHMSDLYERLDAADCCHAFAILVQRGHLSVEPYTENTPDQFIEVTVHLPATGIKI
jgi:DNA-binding CsgD family transcriptional regulator